MVNPFEITGPAVISFSGGRTSALMLRRVLDAGLRDDVHVIFTNTGKELPGTLDFIEAIALRWSVDITWLERRRGGRIDRVTHATASRHGEPFEELIEDRRYLPNPVARLCTQYLKVKATERWCRLKLGWKHWTNAVGMRADEPGRVARMKDQSTRWDTVCPLAESGIMKADVMEFWAAQPFDLGLQPWESNCDHCFLKGAKKRERIERDRGGIDWWIAQEHKVTDRTSGKARTFRSSGPSYETIKARAQLPMLALDEPVDDIDDLGDCVCLEGV